MAVYSTGGGVSNFTKLKDTPASFSGNANKALVVNAAANAVIFGSAIITDHGALTGLADYDHDQYLRKNGAQAMTGDLSMGTHKITNLVDPTSNQHAATKKYVDDNAGVTDHGALTGLADDDHTQYLLVSGARAMTGDLELTGSRYVKATGELYLDAGAGEEVWVNKHFAPMVDNSYILGGSTYRWSALYAVLGHFYGTLDMHSHRITNVLDPTANQDAVTKYYVDAEIITDHDLLNGLGNYDHDQYLRKNGGQAMTGDLDIGSNWVINTRRVASPATETLFLHGRGSTKLSLLSSYVICYVDFEPNTDNSFKNGDSSERWSDIYAVNTHWGDLGFTETTCPKCDKKFKLGDNIILKVIRFDEEDGGIMTIPIHAECADLPPKTITKKYAVKEDYYVWDEEKGEAIKRKRNKSVTKKVKKRKTKEGNFEFDDKKGEFWKLKKEDKGGMMLKEQKVSVNDATEEIEEELREVVYEDKEFII